MSSTLRNEGVCFLKKSERQATTSKQTQKRKEKLISDILDDDFPSKTKKRHKKHSSKDSSNKLRFKKSHKKCETDTESVNSSKTKHNDTDISSDDESPSYPTVDQFPTQKSTTKSKGSYNSSKYDGVLEYGPKINGYRFVSLNPNEDDDTFNGTNYTKHTSRPDINAGYRQSLPKTDWPNQYDPYKSEKYRGAKHDTQYNYDAYCDMWDKLLSSTERCKGSVPLPVKSNKIDDLNTVSVGEFLVHRDNVKKERIRWHPDPMLNRLKTVGFDKADVESLVTQVFQVLNDVYEMQK
ncbi:unnamed protein product [Ambrosiozyma monospora]|uniref:Unnamed protein product n=1 Tax=Ambrosiozyma monospora TaxID=43982 RepID=A0ACB5SYV7_AMBMO|nr:unnamed protein product [Ambrosiozyma monospora]